jgi:hypothetical protein
VGFSIFSAGLDETGRWPAGAVGPIPKVQNIVNHDRAQIAQIAQMTQWTDEAIGNG